LLKKPERSQGVLGTTPFSIAVLYLNSDMVQMIKKTSQVIFAQSLAVKNRLCRCSKMIWEVGIILIPGCRTTQPLSLSLSFSPSLSLLFI